MSAYEVRPDVKDLCPIWRLLGPNGLYVGEPFNCPEDAERVCDLCNDAFARGVEVGAFASATQAAFDKDALEARVAKLEEIIRWRL